MHMSTFFRMCGKCRIVFYPFPSANKVAFNIHRNAIHGAPLYPSRRIDINNWKMFNIRIPLITPSRVLWSESLAETKENKKSVHSLLWALERALALGLLVIIPENFFYPNQYVEICIAITAVLHNHWGLEAVVVDYIRPNLMGSVISKLGIVATYALSAAILYGMMKLILQGDGIAATFKMFWKIGEKEKEKDNFFKNVNVK